MVERRKIFFSGVTGFIGSSLFKWFSDQTDYEVVGAVRESARLELVATTESLKVVGDMRFAPNWRDALQGCDVVVHCAGLSQIKPAEKQSSQVKDGFLVNVEGALRLALQSVECGVKRFIFLSSIKVNGESTSGRKPFSASDVEAPIGEYAHSKFQAEKLLLALSQSLRLEVVIIRLPLVYGPGVGGNFGRLVNLIAKDIPLPFASFNNRRAMINTRNLASLVELCSFHPRSAGQIFLASDGNDIELGELVRKLVREFGNRRSAIPFPVSMMRGLSALLLGKREVISLFDDLEVDISKTQRILGWDPPYTLEYALKEIIQGYDSSVNVATH